MRARIPWGREALAGLAGAIGSVPDGMATAVLAGANPMAGLYASVTGPMVGALAQSTAVMVIATTSAAAVTTAQATAEGPDEVVRTLATLSVLTGIVIVVASLLGIARLLRYVSASVMSGFIFGVGMILVFGQLADAAGVSATGDSVAAKTWDTLAQIRAFDAASMATAAAAIVLAVIMGRGRAKAFAPLVAIVVPSLAVRMANTQVATVSSTSGPIDAGLPPLVLPDVASLDLTLVSTAAALTVVILVQAAGVGTAYPNRDGVPNDTTRDFVAQGAANAASGVVGGIPIGGSVGQTALNVLAGGTTRWSVALSGLWMLLFVVALGPLLSNVPIPALAGLLILAGVQSLRPRELTRSWRTSRSSAIAAGVTLLATLLVPVHLAVLVGVLLSLILVGVDSARSVRVTVLEPAGGGRWRRVEGSPAATAGAVLVLDVDGPATFVSAARFDDLLPRPPPARSAGSEDEMRRFAVVLRLRSHLQPNVTVTEALEHYGAAIARSDGRLFVCGLPNETVEVFRKVGITDVVTLVPEGALLGQSLADAHDAATHWVLKGS